MRNKEKMFMVIFGVVLVSMLVVSNVAAFSMGLVDGIWSTIDSGGGATCDGWATGPASNSINYDATTTRSGTLTTAQGVIGGTDWNQVRYGVPSTEGSCDDTPNRTYYGLQSGFGFDGVDNIGAINNPYMEEPFMVGKFCHFNNQISSPANAMGYVDLTFRVSSVRCPDNTVPTPDDQLNYNFRFALDETTNNASPCPYGDSQPCGDMVTLSRTQSWDTFTCQVSGAPTQYTLDVIGMIPAVGGTCSTTYDPNALADTLFSDEQADNCSCLWAQLSAYSPTAVDLIRFDGSRSGWKVNLTWETARESDNLGFNVYRSLSKNGAKVKVNAEMINTLVPPGSPFGATYTFMDKGRDPSKTYFYWLEDVSLSGQTHLNGPVKVSPEK
jgi:hypothetical protein